MTDPQVARRKLFMHSAHKTVGVSAGPAAWRARESTAPAMAGDARRPPSVCLVSGSPAYRSDQSLAAFEGHLREHGNVECSRAFRRRFDRADLVVWAELRPVVRALLWGADH